MNLCGLFNAKASLVKKKKKREQWYNLTLSWVGDKGVHAFLKGTRPKMNIIVPLEFELAYFEAAVHYFSHVKSVQVVQRLSSWEMDMATRVQILDEADCISLSIDTLGKGINPIILPLATGK